MLKHKIDSSFSSAYGLPVVIEAVQALLLDEFRDWMSNHGAE